MCSVHPNGGLWLLGRCGGSEGVDCLCDFKDRIVGGCACCCKEVWRGVVRSQGVALVRYCFKSRVMIMAVGMARLFAKGFGVEERWEKGRGKGMVGDNCGPMGLLW